MNPFSSTPASVSVVMLAYNHGPYIRLAIEGVLQQIAEFPIELLIGEDCSTDNTLQIAREYETSSPGRVRVITSGSNVGFKANLRRIEECCRSKYVAYCEGDDYWHDPRKLEKQISFLEANPEYTLSHTEYQTKFVTSGRVIPNAARQPKNLNDADAFNDLLSGRRLVLTLTVCARASALKAVLSDSPECYDPRFLMGDTQRWLELARRGKVKCLHEVTATHLILQESASQSKDPKRALRFMQSADDVLKHYIAKYGCPHKIVAMTIYRSGLGVLACAYAAGDFKAAEGVLKEFREYKLSPTLQSVLYCFGSRSRVNYQIARPCLLTLHLWGKVWRRISPY